MYCNISLLPIGESLGQRLHASLLILLALGLGACATPCRYPPGNTPTLPELQADYAVMDDGFHLPLSFWSPKDGVPCQAVLLALHGLNDYRAAFSELGPFLAERGVAMYAYDQRGFGDTKGAGYWHGWKRLTRDLREMISLLRKAHPACPLYVLGESMGGAVILAALSDAPLDIEGEILVAPAVWSRETMPVYQRVALWFAAHTLPGKRLTGEGLKLHPSDNIEMLRALGRDPKVIKATRVDVLYGVTNLMDVAAAVPVTRLGKGLLLYGMHDEIIPRQPACHFLDRLEQAPNSPWVRLYPKGYHMLTRDLNARRVWEDIADWLAPTGKVVSDGKLVDRFCHGDESL